MRDVVSFITGHVDGLRADLEHVLAGRLDMSTLTEDERVRVAAYRMAIARLESIANERLVDVGSHNIAMLIDETGKAYQDGVVQGLASAVHVIDSRLRLLPAAVFRTARQNELRHVRERVANLRDNHGRPTPRPLS